MPLFIVTDRQKQLERIMNWLYNYSEEAGRSYYNVKPSDHPSGRAMLDADAHEQVMIICIALENPFKFPFPRTSLFNTLISQLCRHSLPYAQDDVRRILRFLNALKTPQHAPIQSLLRSLTHYFADSEQLAVHRASLEQLHETANSWYECTEKDKFLKLLDEILGERQKTRVYILDDEWGNSVRVTLDEMDEALRERWLALLVQCSKATSSTPSAKWLAQTQPLIEALDKETFYRIATEWMSVFGKRAEQSPQDDNATLLRGLAWCCAGAESASLASALASAAIEGYRKISGVGPRSAKVGSACVYALKTMPVSYGAAQLERVRLNVKQPTYRTVVENALDELAQQANMSREDLEELTVPTFDLVDGQRRITLGSANVEIRVDGLAVHTQWYDAKGRPVKAVPADVRRGYKAELSELKRLVSDISRLLTAQQERLERLPLTERTWSFATWRERYLHHPFVGSVARRLIWHCVDGERGVDVIWHDERLVDAQDNEVSLSDDAVIATWHPTMCQAEEILAWRLWLERHEVTQPFKQAHREVYLLTDAERGTRVYSNRFAAHILRQHQFNALAAGRGWRNTLRLMVDDCYPPATLELPHWGIRAEFWIEGTGDDYGTDTNDAGTYLYVATDQVRFYPIQATRNSAQSGSGDYRPVYNFAMQQRVENEPLELTSIPFLVFSEVMRDVDLFVGVASVGNDPTWQDGGPERHTQFQNYWHSYSFGDLSVSAEERKQFLSRLLPRLTIGNRCTIDGRFLRVRGDLRTYKIHLGSGNILMEPNDQYLCIVPRRGANDAESAQGIFLPFEGDTMLSIILSKAFLLADDTNITDTSITRQIGISR